jgi:hypothetical protein
MISKNQKKIEEKKIKNQAGGITNESMFGGDIREMRSRKVMIVPSVNADSAVKLEQGWNKRAIQKDVVRVTIKGQSAIVNRAELEQGIWAMAQSDEVIKYSAPSKIGKLATG